MFNFNVATILGYGVIGLGFLLAFLSFWLLRRTPGDDRGKVKLIYAFMIFSFAVINVGIVSEYLRYLFDVRIQNLMDRNESLVRINADLSGTIDAMKKSAINADVELSRKVKVVQNIVGAMENNIATCKTEAWGASTNTGDAGGCTAAAITAMKAGDTARLQAHDVMGALSLIAPSAK